MENTPSDPYGRSGRPGALLPAVAALLLAAATGCRHDVVNLTPTIHAPVADQKYRFEVSVDTNRKSARKESIRSVLLIDGQTFEMTRTPFATNRWQTIIGLPHDNRPIYYRYRIDFNVRDLATGHPESLLTEIYRFDLTEPRPRVDSVVTP